MRFQKRLDNVILTRDTVILVQSAVNPNPEPVRSNGIKIGLVNPLLKPRIGLIGWCGATRDPRPAALPATCVYRAFYPSSVILILFGHRLLFRLEAVEARNLVPNLEDLSHLRPRQQGHLLQSVDNSTIGRSRGTFARRRNKKRTRVVSNPCRPFRNPC